MRAVVITTVNEPTAAVRAFAAMPGYRAFVVADRKTPLDWHVPGVCFLPDNSQSQMAALLPHDHYCRKCVTLTTISTISPWRSRCTRRSGG